MLYGTHLPHLRSTATVTKPLYNLQEQPLLKYNLSVKFANHFGWMNLKLLSNTWLYATSMLFPYFSSYFTCVSAHAIHTR